jgi:hypothetical protein
VRRYPCGLHRKESRASEAATVKCAKLTKVQQRQLRQRHYHSHVQPLRTNARSIARVWSKKVSSHIYAAAVPQQNMAAGGTGLCFLVAKASSTMPHTDRIFIKAVCAGYGIKTRVSSAVQTPTPDNTQHRREGAAAGKQRMVVASVWVSPSPALLPPLCALPPLRHHRRAGAPRSHVATCSSSAG